MIAALQGEMDLPTLQRQDENLASIISYVETGLLPTDESMAKKVALTESQYVVEDRVLYKVEPDSTLRVIPSRSQRLVVTT